VPRLILRYDGHQWYIYVSLDTDLQHGPDFYWLSYCGRVTFLEAIYYFALFSHMLQRYTLGVSRFGQCDGPSKEVRGWLK
jgi:hypothetical protein